MSQDESWIVPVGTVLEFFESREIVCGVCLAEKNGRLSILTEHNRELNLAQSRIIHFGSEPLPAGISRDQLVQRLLSIRALRSELMEDIRVEELWSLLESEEDGYDVRQLAEFVFPTPVTDHQVAATQRVLLLDRLYFQFKDGKFFARSADKVEQRRLEMQREVEREERLDKGSRWLHAVWNRKPRMPLDDEERLIGSLKSFCLFGQESPESGFVKELLKRAAVPCQTQAVFRLLVRLGVWHENENLFLHEQGITPDFPEEVTRAAEAAEDAHPVGDLEIPGRRDLRHLHVLTIDSPLTRDYDDALSLRVLDDGLFEVGVHIADAAHFVPKGGTIDREAESRASSIYLPDGRICMIPPSLSEGICSLRAGEDRPALSFLIKVDGTGIVRDWEITSSLVRVREQITYEQANQRIENDPALAHLHDLAAKLRAARIENGAVILPLPEINVYVNSAGMIQVYRYEKESPSQITVSEWMIAANALAASFLAKRDIPSIFRSQGECKPETDFTQSEHEIFHIYRQRRLFARAELDTRPKAHCALALPHYTTVTSPIRRYTDLVVQRQIKHLLAGQAQPYMEDELQQLIVKLGVVQSRIFFIQRRWNRYWILKYMEQEDKQILDAIILERNDRYAHLLLPDFLIEINAPVPENSRLQAGQMTRVKLERINPREDILKVQLPDFG